MRRPALTGITTVIVPAFSSMLLMTMFLLGAKPMSREMVRTAGGGGCFISSRALRSSFAAAQTFFASSCPGWRPREIVQRPRRMRASFSDIPDRGAGVRPTFLIVSTRAIYDIRLYPQRRPFLKPSRPLVRLLLR